MVDKCQAIARRKSAENRKRTWCTPLIYHALPMFTHGKWPIYSWFTYQTCSSSAMLVYQRVAA